MKLKHIYLLATVLLSLPYFTNAQNNNSQTETEFFSISLEELLTMDVHSSSLTKIKNNLTSTSVTVITSRDIELSGARNLDELLEIYVPSFVMLFKGGSGNSFGARGIVNDRNDKVLLLVNGKNMSAKYSTGVFSERLFSMLADIYKIEVIESPQSSLYGPGGISMVINIYTKSASLIGKKNEVTVNHGEIDRYTNVQLLHANRIGDKFSYSAYYGVDRQSGASQSNAPIKFSFRDTIQTTGALTRPNQAIDFSVNNLNASSQDFRHKAHAEVQYGDFSAWARYTNAGIEVTPSQGAIFNSNQDSLAYGAFSYNHMTAFVQHKKNTNDRIQVDTRLSFDQLNRQTYTNTSSIASDIKESEYYARSVISYNTDKLSIAAGPVISHEIFEDVIEGGDNWSTTTYSGIGEIQYLPLENLSIVAGARMDKHTYTEALWSPKAAIVWRPVPSQLVRFQYSRSNRRADDQVLHEAIQNDLTIDNNEVIDFYELSGEVKVTDQVNIKPNVFYANYDIISWNHNFRQQRPLGKLKYTGLGLSAVYKNKKHFLNLSHQYVRVVSLDLAEDASNRNNISSEPFGYGNSFHNFPDHLTKLVYQLSINDRMSVSSSVQVNWGMRGAEDGGRYNDEVLGSLIKMGRYGSDEAFSPSAYMHIGYLYNDVVPNLSLGVFGHNILGLIDEDLNKRGEFFRNSQYRIQPASFTIRASYNF